MALGADPWAKLQAGKPRASRDGTAMQHDEVGRRHRAGESDGNEAGISRVGVSVVLACH